MLFVIYEQECKPKYSQAGLDALSTALAFGQNAALLLIPRKATDNMAEISETARTQLYELGLRDANILCETTSNKNDAQATLHPLEAKQVSLDDYRDFSAQHKFILSF